MRRFVRSSCTGLCFWGALSLGGCTDEGNPAANGAAGTGGASAGMASSAGSSSGGASGSGNATAGAAGSTGGAGGVAGGAGSSAGSGGSAGAGGAGGAMADVCGDALFCEQFDGYAAITNIADKQKFGPWRAELKTGASMNLEGTHKMSGSSALHVHIDNVVEAGGRLWAEGAQPIFANKPTHLYGRMMMYIDPNGASIHWTFFGVNGKAESGSPVAGKNGSYIMSSLPKQNVNTYSFVYGLSADDGFHDCSSQSSTSMPSAWACVAFEMDSVARKLRMYKDADAAPILSVDDHGKGCVPPTNVNDPWYGPAVEQLFVGAYSFHPMKGPLDVWIDDLVVDTKPVPCPPQ